MPPAQHPDVPHIHYETSLHLAHHILHTPGILSHPSEPGDTQALPPVVELGAGTGFLSILVTQLGADVIATDLGESGVEEASMSPLVRLRVNVALS